MDNTTAPAAATEAPAGQLTDSAMADDTSTTAVVAESVAPPAPAVDAAKVEVDRAAAKFAALTRQDKALKMRERQLAQNIKAHEDRIKAAADAGVDATKYIDVADFKKNPYKYMKDHGLTLEQVAEIVMNDGKVTPESLAAQTESKFEAKIKQLEKRLEEKEAREQDEKMNHVLHNFKTKLTGFVNDTSDYEMIRAQDSDGVQLVYDVIDTHYNEQVTKYTEENGEAPSIEERQDFILDNKTACDMVESWLLDQEKARIAKARTLTKTKGLFEPAAKPIEQKVKSPNSTTLTNTLSAQVPSKDSKTLTDEESKKEAAKLIRWDI